MTNVTLIIGGATFGDNAAYSTVEELQPLLDILKSYDVKNIDTAARYPSGASRTSERLIHSTKAVEQGFVVDTKVNVLYCHSPDYKTPLEETTRAFNELYKEGRFEKWGISNISAPMLKDILEICEENGYAKPSVYQGQYNPVCRKAESELFPLLKSNNIAYNAYSPLAGGFFTGKLTRGGTALKGTRYESGSPRWDKPIMHTALNQLLAVIEPLGISGPEAALRWLAYHSALQEGDGIILGCSKVSQIERNIEDIKKGPLPQEVVDIFEKIWKDVEGEAPPYSM